MRVRGENPSEWGLTMWALVKGAPRSVKPRVDNKQHQPITKPNPYNFHIFVSLDAGLMLSESKGLQLF